MKALRSPQPLLTLVRPRTTPTVPIRLSPPASTSCSPRCISTSGASLAAKKSSPPSSRASPSPASSAQSSASPAPTVTPLSQVPQVPRPTPFIPDVETFLTVIGRNLKQYKSKFPSWEAMFTLSTDELRELGIEPPRSRRYLLKWLHRFRNGRFGPGGDFRYVQDGTAILKVARTIPEAVSPQSPPAPPAKGKGKGKDAKTPATSTPAAPKYSKWVVNMPPGVESPNDISADRHARPQFYSIRGLATIVGPHAQPLANSSGAKVVLVEGMWENRRGQKVDGGERRQAEVRFKKKVEARKAEKEAALRPK